MTAIRATTKEQSIKFQAALRIEGKMQKLARYLDVYNAIFLADCKALKEIQTTAALESLEISAWFGIETAQLTSVKNMSKPTIRHGPRSGTTSCRRAPEQEEESTPPSDDDDSNHNKMSRDTGKSPS
ncbi:hypothetical protein CAEBREN_03083 [Caenorhabditis brenneri]|uniref:Uncharacterized protein n=1 Tax=Caenorhabditis brenneri TaxID=135651 RepID=G0N1P1_CAEBE|nr:hypothetical protein CAEBREN_03083 [Caenorhabditis brenneri]